MYPYALEAYESAVGAEPAPPTCTPCLPSGTSAYRVMKGETAAIPTAVGHMLARSGLIGLGLYVGGLRGGKLVKNALLGGAAIELFVLAWASTQIAQENG